MENWVHIVITGVSPEFWSHLRTLYQDLLDGKIINYYWFTYGFGFFGFSSRPSTTTLPGVTLHQSTGRKYLSSWDDTTGFLSTCQSGQDIYAITCGYFYRDHKLVQITIHILQQRVKKLQKKKKAVKFNTVLKADRVYWNNNIQRP